MRAILPKLHNGAHLVMLPLPASVDDEGLAMTEWLLSDDDRDRLLCGGRVRVWVLTNDYSRPIAVEALCPDDSGTKES